MSGFKEVSQNLTVGDGLLPDTKMGPLAHDRRLEAIDEFVKDAVKRWQDRNRGRKKRQ